jgi:type I site-specific restriction-modification system R (restriction) subunit
MTQSVEDNATRPVFYESRVVALKLDKDKLAQLDAAYAEFAETANEASIEKAKRDTGGLDALFGAPETLATMYVFKPMKGHNLMQAIARVNRVCKGKESARAGMRRAIKWLLRKYKYPPEGAEEALATVMAQCELWADTNI